MNRITRNMYGTLADPKEGLFGFTSGRIVMSATEACHEAWWYNVFGEKTGAGSLAFSDLQRIAEGLLSTELFVTAWIPADLHAICAMGFAVEGCADAETLNVKGLEYYATCVVSRGMIHVPRNNKALAERLRGQKIRFDYISRRELLRLISVTRGANIAEN